MKKAMVCSPMVRMGVSTVALLKVSVRMSFVRPCQKWPDTARRPFSGWTKRSERRTAPGGSLCGPPLALQEPCSGSSRDAGVDWGANLHWEHLQAGRGTGHVQVRDVDEQADQKYLPGQQPAGCLLVYLLRTHNTG